MQSETKKLKRSKTVEHKTWNVRDQTDSWIEHRREDLYREIDKNYRLLRKAAKIEDAEKLLQIIYRQKGEASEIEIELMRRRAYGETK